MPSGYKSGIRLDQTLESFVAVAVETLTKMTCRTVCSDYVTDPCGFFPGHSWITCGSNFVPPYGWSNSGPFAPYRYGGGYGGYGRGCC
ncbi:unnamed protein product [Protopolystoma xenopodis]|uniref:Uncharacterized protein n=1 Tax=Protopolystoma xenopodis TaxID=117903 RepID=A0A448WZX8_9PLAT|nr:unnamed protein product [Protopolystoma xenopodis]